jgi:hypothetical protein
MLNKRKSAQAAHELETQRDNAAKQLEDFAITWVKRRRLGAKVAQDELRPR